MKKQPRKGKSFNVKSLKGLKIQPQRGAVCVCVCVCVFKNLELGFG